MTLPRVSIMIPTYNQSEFLQQSVESAMAQDYPNLEIIVSDDASTDATREIMGQYTGDPRVRYFQNETNLGRVANYRLTLYKRVGGEWVLNLDGDDRLTEPTFISKAVRAAQRQTNTVLVCGRCAEVSPEGVRRVLPTNANAPRFMEGKDLFRALPKGWLNIFHLAALYRRETALRIGFYRLDTLSSDRESLYRLILEGDVAFIPEIAGDWRRHQDSAGLSSGCLARLENLIIFTSVAQSAVARRRLSTREARRWLRAMRGNELRGILLNELQRGGYPALAHATSVIGAKQTAEAVLSLLSPSPWLRRLQSVLQKD